MKGRRIVDGRNGRVGFKFHYRNPVTGKWSNKTIRLSDAEQARRGMAKFMEGLERKALGLPDPELWRTPYSDLIARFLTEAPIASARRRERLKAVLERNPLRLRAACDLNDLAELNRRVRRLAERKGPTWVINTVQKPLKQLTAWLACNGLLPWNPLRDWQNMRRTSRQESYEAFDTFEMRRVLDAVDFYDDVLGHKFPLGIVYRVLLLTGNRPGVLLGAKVCDLLPERIKLPEGNGRKRNGKSYMPAGFVDELKAYVMMRRDVGLHEPILLSPDGSRLDMANARKYFCRAMVLAFVRMCWPSDKTITQGIDELEVAYLLDKDRTRGFDGVPPRDQDKMARRAAHAQAVEALAATTRDSVARLCRGRTMYSLRSTHITWARQFVPNDVVDAQVGHAGRTTQERHYLDQELVYARRSADAVWDVLHGRLFLRGEIAQKHVLRLAAGAGGTGLVEGPGRGREPEGHSD